MGNRAVLTFSQAPSAPAIYLHWNGGRASVEGFLQAARTIKLDASTDTERMDEFADMCARFFNCRVGLTVYREPYGRTDRDNGDNGVYLISRDWHIAGRIHAPKHEEIDATKTADIAAECVAHMSFI